MGSIEWSEMSLNTEKHLVVSCIALRGKFAPDIVCAVLNPALLDSPSKTTSRRLEKVLLITGVSHSYNSVSTGLHTDPEPSPLREEQCPSLDEWGREQQETSIRSITAQSDVVRFCRDWMDCFCHSAPPLGFFDWSAWLILVMVIYFGGNKFMCVRLRCTHILYGWTDRYIYIHTIFLFHFTLRLQFKFLHFFSILGIF